MTDDLNHSQEYLCNTCNFFTKNKAHYKKHTMSMKHINLNETEKKTPSLCISCGEDFPSKYSLYRHRKKHHNCDYDGMQPILDYQPMPPPSASAEPTIAISTLRDICSILQSNKEDTTYQNETIKLLVGALVNRTSAETSSTTVVNSNYHDNDDPISKKSRNCTVNNMSNCNIGNTMNNSNNTITHNNNSFNLQVFLNETCKEAMNMKDFLKSVKLDLNDLEKVGRLGYAEGISSAFIKHLNKVDVTKRPIHCTDPKRDVVYIKENDVWEKEEEDYPKFKKAIKEMEYKHMDLIPEWQAENPDHRFLINKKNDQYNSILQNTMGVWSTPKETEHVLSKVIRNVNESVTIDKEKYAIDVAGHRKNNKYNKNNMNNMNNINQINEL